MKHPKWWVEGAEVTIAQANQKKLSPKDKSYPADIHGLERLRQDLIAKSCEGWAYTLAEDCRKLIEWRDGGK
jgi:hypothetical protein